MVKSEKELRNSSIFFLPSDGRADYEFFVLVDRGKDDNPKFLNQLFEYLENPDNKDLLDNTDPDKGKLGLKVLIERYPIRLFVVSDNEKLENLSGFLRKRICWIKKEEFGKALKGEFSQIGAEWLNSVNLKLSSEEKFKLWLYWKWLNHLSVEWKGVRNGEIALYVGGGGKPRTVYFPITLPECLEPQLLQIPGGGKKNIQSIVETDENKLQEKSEASVLEIPPFVLVDLKELHKKLSGSAAYKAIAYYYHKNMAAYSPSELASKFLYSQGTSGAQTQFPFFSMAIGAPNGVRDYNAFKTIFSLIENGLLRIGIVDERFVEWFDSLSGEEQREILWSGIIPITHILEESKEPYGYTNSEYYKIKMKCGRIELGCKNNLKSCRRPSPLPSISSLDILIIHQGILDKWKIEDLHKKIIEWKEKIPIIVITSGRGKPSGLPMGEKFLPFANFSYIMQVPPDDIIFRKILLGITEVA